LSEQRHKGDRHVKNVVEACKRRMMNQSINEYSEVTQETVEYIFNRFSKISHITSKFDYSNSDAYPDMTIVDGENIKHTINLFLVRGNGSIQPKNLGAKSFFTKYFLSPDLQEQFNLEVEREQETFLKQIIKMNPKTKLLMTTLKKKVKEKYSRFVEEIEPYRASFLYHLREAAFQLLREQYNSEVEKTKYAFEQLLMMNTENIITRHNKKNKCLVVETYKSSANPYEDLHIYKKGQYSIGIRAGHEALLLRFKFESGPTSSIKLATSYETFTIRENILKENERMIAYFDKIILNHMESKTQNKSNAIGKVNEAAVYYEVVKQQPDIYQTDSAEGLQMIEENSKLISCEDLKNILTAAKGAAQKILLLLKEKYRNYQLDSVQLVPDSYLKDRLDTSDLKIIVKNGSAYKEENLSLKALARKTAKVTSKNPGAGAILGSQYFGVSDLTDFLAEVKRNFIIGQLSHEKCLEKVSEKMFAELETAPHKNLQKGLKALLGSSTMVITFYKIDDSLVLEHEEIKSNIQVIKHPKSAIQTILQWSEGHEELSLRVKFSASQKKGWSSLKLACDYTINH
jgi:hypothetical protein